MDLIISELKEYCNDLDLDFVRKAVRAIGIVAVKVERCARRAVEILQELVKQEGADTALQEAIIVATDIFRKYPGKYEILIKDLSAQIKRIDEPESKAAMIWILGEYADKIEQVEKLLAHFAESFNDESI